MLQVSPEDLAAFLAAPPPRRSVPEGLRRRIDEIMAEGSQFGCAGMVLVIGMLLGLSLWFPPTRPDDLKLDNNSLTVPGTVLNVEPTGWRFHWGNTTTPSQSKGAANPLMRYEFSFRTRAGEERTGVCYAKSLPGSWVNGPVTVRYLPEQPAVACIVGAHLGWFSWEMRLVAVPMIGWGLWAMSHRFRSRPRIAALLRTGLAVQAQVTGIEADRLDGRGIRKRITLQMAGAQTLRHTETNRSNIAAFAHYHQTSQPVWVVYDPADPARFILPEFL